MRTWVCEGIGNDEWAIGVVGNDHWVKDSVRVRGKEQAQFIVDACNEKEASLQRDDVREFAHFAAENPRKAFEIAQQQLGLRDYPTWSEPHKDCKICHTGKYAMKGEMREGDLPSLPPYYRCPACGTAHTGAYCP